MKHKVFLIVIIMILLFFYTTGSSILAAQNVNWRSLSGVEKGVKVYFSWLGGVFGNLRVITANAIRMDWASKNVTTGVELIEEGK
jgi:hypothetical protein